MSKIIAAAAIKGAHQIVDKAEDRLKEAIDAKGPNEEVAFPNTGYYLPVIYGLTGLKVEKLADMEPVLKQARELLPPVPTKTMYVPYLGPTLDAGIATLFVEEMIEALRYVIGPAPVGDLYLGAADDVIMRERGVEFVDGSAPGFAAVVGAAPSNDIAVKLVQEMQEKSLYVFMAGKGPDGNTIAKQLQEEGVQLGWDTRLVPFDDEVYGHIYSLGFATRAAMAFGGVKPGDYKKILSYNKNRIFAFVLALDEVDEEKYATAAGAISYGFPTIAHTNIPQILPTGITTYEHVVSGISFDEIVPKAIEVRGLKIVITEIPIPVAYGPAFEGERIRKENMYLQFGGQKTPAFELVRNKPLEEVQDNKIEVIGPEIDADDVEPGSALPLGIMVEVAGRKMQEDFEPILERQFHYFINGATGIWHMGQRNIIWVRISNDAQKAGFKIRHLGEVIRAKILNDYGAIVDKVAVTLYTKEEDVLRLQEEAKKVYKERNERLEGMTDESVDTFYSCLLCQSFAPTHVCVISPEHLGLCGAYNWLDGKAAYEISPTGGNQPVPKGEVLDIDKGNWAGVNTYIKEKSGGTIEGYNSYTMMEEPMTSCGCFECITALLPMANGVMIVNREHPDMTPCGMKFSTLAGTVGGGQQVPGFIGIGRQFITSKKFISADGGFKRIVWMPKELKEQLREKLAKRCEELGDPDFINKIADETVAVTEEEVMEFMQKVGHPALEMEPMF